MKFLTQSECTDWLSLRKFAEKPYRGRDERSQNYLQFDIASHGARSLPLLRCLIGNKGKGKSDLESFDGILGSFEGALLQITDWEAYPPDQYKVVSALRGFYDEKRPLNEAPGQLFRPDEDAELIGQCHLILTYQWTAYLYVMSTQTTFLFWEGVLVDVWTQDAPLLMAIKSLFDQFNLGTISTGSVLH